MYCNKWTEENNVLLLLTYARWTVDVVDESDDACGCYAEQREEDSCHTEHVQLQPLVGNLEKEGDDDNNYYY